MASGGAIITQVEKPDENEVLITDTLFCFNESPMSPHIYNYRSITHECANCRSLLCPCVLNGERIADDPDSHLPQGDDKLLQCNQTETGLMRTQPEA